MKTNVSCSVDTNIILRILIKDDLRLFNKAKKLFEKYENIIIEDVAIIECVYVLSKGYGIERVKIQELIVALIGEANVSANRVQIITALDVFTSKPSLSIQDCFLAEYASGANTALFTLDKKLANQHPNAKLL